MILNLGPMAEDDLSAILEGFEALIAEDRRQGKEAGLKQSDMNSAIAKVRKRRQKSHPHSPSSFKASS